MAASTFNAAKFLDNAKSDFKQSNIVLTTKEEVEFHYVDCHWPGGCGQRNCVPTIVKDPTGVCRDIHAHKDPRVKLVPDTFYATHPIDAKIFQQTLNAHTHGGNPDEVKAALRELNDRGENALTCILRNRLYPGVTRESKTPVIAYSDLKNPHAKSHPMVDFVIEQREQFLQLVVNAYRDDDQGLVALLCTLDASGYAPIHYCYGNDPQVLLKRDLKELALLIQRISYMKDQEQEKKLMTAQTKVERDTILHYMANHSEKFSNRFSDNTYKAGLKVVNAKGNTPVHCIFDARTLRLGGRIETPPLTKVNWFCKLVSADAKQVPEYFGRNAQGKNPLHLAASNARTDANLLAPVCQMLKDTYHREFLLTLLEQKDNQGHTPIDEAVRANKIERLKTLADDLKQPDETKKLFTRNTLEHAFRSNNPEVFDYVLSKIEPEKRYQLLVKQDAASVARYQTVIAKHAPFLEMHLKLVMDLNTLNTDDLKDVQAVLAHVEQFGSLVRNDLLAKGEQSQAYIQFLKQENNNDRAIRVLNIAMESDAEISKKHLHETITSHGWWSASVVVDDDYISSPTPTAGAACHKSPIDHDDNFLGTLESNGRSRADTGISLAPVTTRRPASGVSPAAAAALPTVSMHAAPAAAPSTSGHAASASINNTKRQ